MPVDGGEDACVVAHAHKTGVAMQSSSSPWVDPEVEEAAIKDVSKHILIQSELNHHPITLPSIYSELRRLQTDTFFVIMVRCRKKRREKKVGEVWRKKKMKKGREVWRKKKREEEERCGGR